MSQPSSARLVATLAVAGLCSGVVIVGAHRVTLPRIEAHQAAALERAVLEVLPGAVRFEPLLWDGTQLVAAPAGSSGGETIFIGRAGDGRPIGFAIPAAGAGFQDTIRVLFGVTEGAQRAVGMVILESRETPGLGDRIYKDPKFVAEFRDLALEPAVELVKGHGEAPNQVDGITGATISSGAVVRILNATAATWRPRLMAAPIMADDEVGKGAQR